MEAVGKLLAKFDTNDTFPTKEWRAAMRELYALGLVRNENRPEPAPAIIAHRKTIFPWWIDPVTGEEVRGYKTVMQVAFDRHLEEIAVPKPEPSAQAKRVFDALREKPELAAEVRGLLDETVL